MFAIAVVIVFFNDRNIKKLEPALQDEYKKAKFVPIGMLVLLFLAGISPIFFGWTGWGIFEVKVFLPIYIAAAFIFFRFMKERNLRKTNWPPDLSEKRDFTT
jgi:uncharacterized membrane protein SirB2